MATRYLWKVEEVSTWVKDCVLSTWYPTWQCVGLKYHSDRETVRRAKPSNLIANLTNQPEAYHGYIAYPRWFQNYYPNGDYPCLQDGVWYAVGGTLRPSWAFPSLRPSNVSWEVALRNKIVSESVSFAESIGEYRETLQLFDKVVTGFADYARYARDCLRKGKCRLPKRKASRKKVCRKVRDPRNPTRKRQVCHWVKVPPTKSWNTRLDEAIDMDLAVKFGLAPNIDLLQDAMIALDRVKPDRRRITVTLREDFTYTDGVGLGDGPFATVQESQVTRAVAYVRWTRPYTFTAGNPAEAWWAAVPLSFVVDWFFNVGSYLTGLNALTGVEISGTYSVKARQSVRVTGTYTGSSLLEAGKGVMITHRRDTFNTATLGLGSVKFTPITSNALEKLFTMLEIGKKML